ncbi:MAG: acyltransferase [Tatlockia sp.]|nr:acyltransferase [Tatlockia sp.]
MTSYSHSLSPLKYRQDIDGLRAFAVLAVIGFHAFPKLFKGGFIGVDVFFVISGYLISTLLYKGLANDNFSFREFYGKRIKRIFPALLTVLFFCLALGWFVLYPEEYKQLGKHVAGGSSFISNFLLWAEVGYFDNAAETKPLLHLWSLGIEEQFYIIWPILLWAAWKKRFNLVVLISFIALSSFLLTLKSSSSDAIKVFYSPQTRCWELLCGSLLAWVTSFKPNKLAAPNALLNSIFSLTGFLLLALSSFWLTKLDFPGAWALLPTLGAVLIILAGSKAWFNRIILSNRLIIWFGIISFPLYLWHWPLLSFARIIEEGKPLTRIRVAAIVLSIALAWLTYRFIEQPIRFGKGFGRIKVALLMMLMVFAGAFGLSIYQQQGFNSRFKHLEDLNNLISLVDNPYPYIKTYECGKTIPELKNFDSAGGCRLSKEAPPDILFLGDSHTHHYYNAIFNSFPTKTVMMVVQPSCLPFASDTLLNGVCKKKYQAMLSFLESNSSIKKVYISAYWAYLMTGGFAKTGPRWRQVKDLDTEGVKTFKKNGQQFITTVLKSNKELTFLKDIPDLDFNIRSCFNTRPFQLSYQPRKTCWLDYAHYARRIASYDQVISELLAHFSQVKIYDPRPLFCQNENCVVQANSLPYYVNGDHLNHFGAKLVFEDLLTKESLS